VFVPAPRAQAYEPSSDWREEAILDNTILISISCEVLSVAVLLVLSKTRAILTVRDKILCDPLSGILSSHGSYFNYTHGTTKVHLIPLVPVVVTRAPCTHPGTCAAEVQAAIARTVIHIPA